MTNNNTMNMNATVNNANKVEAAKAKFAEAIQWLYKQSGCRMVVRKLNYAMAEASKHGDINTLDNNIRAAVKSVPVEGAPEYVLKAWDKVKDLVFSFGGFLKTLGGKLIDCMPEFVRTIAGDIGAIISAIMNGLKVVWDASKKVIRLVGIGALKLAALLFNTLGKFIGTIKGKLADRKAAKDSKMEEAMQDLKDACMEYSSEEYSDEDLEFETDCCTPEKKSLFAKITGIFRK